MYVQAYLAGSVAGVAATVGELLGARTALHKRNRTIFRAPSLERRSGGRRRLRRWRRRRSRQRWGRRWARGRGRRSLRFGRATFLVCRTAAGSRSAVFHPKLVLGWTERLYLESKGAGTCEKVFVKRSLIVDRHSGGCWSTIFVLRRNTKNRVPFIDAPGFARYPKGVPLYIERIGNLVLGLGPEGQDFCAILLRSRLRYF